MDFLVGDRLTSSDSSTWTTTGRRRLMGQVLRMESPGALTEFLFSEHLGSWCATFMSPLGDHDVMTGALDGEVMILDQPVVRGRPGVGARVTFRDVRASSFDSDFLVSADGGETWRVEFTMHYERLRPVNTSTRGWSSNCTYPPPR